jgi:hypothetical protein
VGLPEEPVAADCQQPGGIAELIDEPVAMPMATEVHAILALAPTSGDGALRGLPPRKTGQAVSLPEEPVAADCQQPGGTAGLLDEPAAMPMTTEVQATLALAPTSVDGASSGLPSRKEGQAECLPEEQVAADCQQLKCTAGLLDEPTAVPTSTEVQATTFALAPTPTALHEASRRRK